ncbi:MAG: hypothetical protein ICV60_05645 [Pyrinomonadaceae bacterium]|nr:hypothetical protein [Pyrinomonadaceae bacterium]
MNDTLRNFAREINTHNPTCFPQAITDEVKRFCSRINPKSAPVLIDHCPQPWAAPNQCIANCMCMVKLKGGHAEVGYMILETRGMLLFATGHVVWRSALKRRIDVTPTPYPPSDFTLFLPAPVNMGAGKKRTPSVVMPLENSEDVQRLIEYYRAIASEVFGEDLIVLDRDGIVVT